MNRRIGWEWLTTVLLMASILPARLAAEDAAVVNGHVITTEEVDGAFRRTSVARKQLTEDQTKLYRRHVLNVLINDSLVNQYLDNEKITVPEAEVDAHVAEIRKQLAAKGRTLESYLAELGIDEARMRTDIRNIHRWLKYVDRESTEKTLRSYFEASKAAFDGSQVRASHILVKVPSDATDEQRATARKKIESIRAQLAGGTSFAEAAKAFSDCPSREQGGDLDYFPRKGVMSEPFAAAAFALPIGNVSEIVETEFGYHLIVVTARKPGKAVTFEEVADDVKAIYADDLRATVISKMRGSADIKILR